MYIYELFIKEDVILNQVHSLDEFLELVDLIVILVGHDEIKDNMNKLDNKLVLDTKYIYVLKKERIDYKKR